MSICPACGHENSDAAKYCEECATPLAVALAAREQRKTVTVLFCDVTGSTALGESTDPEALRALLARYFERMKGIIESHGGTVEKFIGDAVMAVFGVPVAHEDDALRAVRAAIEMRDALPELDVQARIGLSTGEVVTGTAERLATGDAVNVAARLEQAAERGEVLIGQETLALVRDAVEVDAVEPLDLKGKAQPVAAYRLLSVVDVPERSYDTRFVGRERELGLISSAWKRVVDEQRCELVTVVGDAGVGKSRLAAEFLDSTKATVVRGRCPPYGDGITYWPVVEVLKQIDLLPTDEAAAVAIRSLLGGTDTRASAEEIAWAFRKTLEQAALERPLVAVFDDIQWGEATFRDLIEHVALLSSGAAILLLCIARPELTERHSAWPVTFRLEPLAEGEVDELIGERVPDRVRERIARTSGGNPLFIEEMLAMAGEAEGEVVVPPTLQALLASRLDQLETAERSVLERAAVEGEIFHRGAVQALAPGESQITPRLAALARKGLIRPDTAQLAGEDGFRFRHLLIRDAAYDALPKSVRAELHERFAAWLQAHGEELVELDELLGYHLEQAAGYATELGLHDSAPRDGAGEHLARAGRRAQSRGDLPAAASLLERALVLTRPLRLDVHLELDLADAQPVPHRRAALAAQTAERARAAGDQAGEALALVLAAHARFHFEDAPSVEELERLAQAALPLLEEAEDHAGLAWVWSALGTGVLNTRGRYEEWTQAAEEALRQLRLAGRLPVAYAGLPLALVVGPRPADEALDSLDRVLLKNPHPVALLSRAQLLAMLGRFDEAWALALPAAARQRELLEAAAWGGNVLAEIAALAGDHATAADHLRGWCEMLQRHGIQALLSTYAPQLGRYLCALGSHDEAEPLAKLGRELANEHDLSTHMLWRQVLGLVHAHRGEHAEAERLARQAVEIGAQTDALNMQGDALCDLAEVLQAAGRNGEAAAALEEALERYERKKNVAMVAQVKPKLGEVRRTALA